MGISLDKEVTYDFCAIRSLLVAFACCHVFPLGLPDFFLKFSFLFWFLSPYSIPVAWRNPLSTHCLGSGDGSPGPEPAGGSPSNSCPRAIMQTLAWHGVRSVACNPELVVHCDEWVSAPSSTEGSAAGWTLCARDVKLTFLLCSNIFFSPLGILSPITHLAQRSPFMRRTVQWLLGSSAWEKSLTKLVWGGRWKEFW